MVHCVVRQFHVSFVDGFKMGFVIWDSGLRTVLDDFEDFYQSS